MKSNWEKNKTIWHALTDILMQRWMLLSLLFLFPLLAYSQIYHGEFQFDDIDYVLNNVRIRSFSGFWTHLDHIGFRGRMIPFLTFTINYFFHGYDVWGYHAVNVFIHLINILLVRWLVLEIAQTPRLKTSYNEKDRHWLAIATALIFAVHPLQIMAVTYITQRFASLLAMFYLLAVIMFLKSRLTKRIFFYGGLGLCAAVGAIFSKENAVTIPVTIIMLEWLLFRHQIAMSRFKKPQWIGFMVALILLILIAPALYHFRWDKIFASNVASWSYWGEYLNPWTYALTQTHVVVRYLSLSVFPVGLRVLYEMKASQSLWEPAVLLSLLFICANFILAWRLRRKQSLVSLAVAWFFITIAVESSFIPIRHVIFEHRMYLPMVGVAILMSGLLLKIFQIRRYATLALLVITGTLTFLTYQRNQVWLTEEALWRDNLAKEPNLMRPYLNLAGTLINQRRFDEALPIIERGLAKRPDYTTLLSHKAVALQMLDRHQEALQAVNLCLQLDPTHREAYGVRAEIYKKTGQLKKALDDYHQAIALNRDLHTLYHNRGTVLMSLQRSEEALKDFEYAIKILPDYPEAFSKGSIILFQRGEIDEALNWIDQAIRIDPNLAEAHLHRGIFMAARQNWKEALASYNRVTELNSDMVHAYNNRALVWQNLGDLKKAETDLRMALTITQTDPQLFKNLGDLYLRMKDYDAAWHTFVQADQRFPNEDIFQNRLKALTTLKSNISKNHKL